MFMDVLNYYIDLDVMRVDMIIILENMEFIVCNLMNFFLYFLKI